MRAITIRTQRDSKLIAFGPENGMYDPGPVKTGQVRVIEADYEAVLAEWQAAQPAPVERKASLRQAKSVSDLIAALDALL